MKGMPGDVLHSVYEGAVTGTKRRVSSAVMIILFSSLMSAVRRIQLKYSGTIETCAFFQSTVSLQVEKNFIISTLQQFPKAIEYTLVSLLVHTSNESQRDSTYLAMLVIFFLAYARALGCHGKDFNIHSSVRDLRKNNNGKKMLDKDLRCVEVPDSFSQTSKNTMTYRSKLHERCKCSRVQ